MTHVFRAWSPAENRELGPAYRAATREQVLEACEAAHAAAEACARTRGEQRARFLLRIAEELQADAVAILACAAAETGLAPSRLEGELLRTRNQLAFLAEIVRTERYIDARIERADPARTPLARPDLRSMLVPIGPVAVFGASNFPLAFSTAGGDTASALAVGCPVIVKAHPLHPGTSLLAGAAIERARAFCGLPVGAFAQLLSGGERSHAVGLELVQDPRIRAVGFTGSLEGGRALMRAIEARATPIPLYAELGALNPLFVLPGALRERREAITAQLLGSISGSAGQLCTRPGLIFSSDPTLAEELAVRARALAPQPMLSPAHRRALAARWQARGRLAGVECLHADDPEREEVGVVIERCSLATFLCEPSLREECFGPSTLLVTCADAAQWRQAAASLPGTLTASVLRAAADEALARELLALLAPLAGRLIADGVPTGVEVNQAMQHGGPWPSSTRPDTTSVGGRSILRWLRPICFQNWPQDWLPPALQDDPAREGARRIDGPS